MAGAWDDLHAAFEQGAQGVDALPAFERDLYWIMFFILSFESGGWLYNWTDQGERFAAVIAAMQRRGLRELAEILVEINRILQRAEPIERQLTAEKRTITWREMLKLIDPERQLEELETRIGAMDGYSVPDHWDRTNASS